MEPKTSIRIKLLGSYKNSFNIVGRVSKALRTNGHEDLVDEYIKEATSGDYNHLLQTTMKYVHVE
ncbi:MAG: hypothetical protein AVO38_10940 [delta proteobacterium ML8_D]|nr:MAG: hypothetical protein AVO34_05335 [Firmicutes bacterium ML8_F2]OPL15103.1 MAG: hypothetical protein AVO38_10940 [delta proteobacterium ML8_D]